MASVEVDPLTADLTDADRVKLSFTYDHQHRRTSKTVARWDSVANDFVTESVTKFIYDGHRLVAETNADNELIRSYVWSAVPGPGGVGGLRAIRVHDPTPGSGFPVTATYWVISDDNGNVTALVDADTEAIVASYQYTPFGQVLHAEGDADALAANPFGFSTKYHDAELPGDDLVYYGYRYYHPALQVWLNRDPIAEDGGLNLYAYAGNQPNSNVDIDGRDYIRVTNGKAYWVVQDDGWGWNNTDRFSIYLGTVSNGTVTFDPSTGGGTAQLSELEDFAYYLWNDYGDGDDLDRAGHEKRLFGNQNLDSYSPYHNGLLAKVRKGERIKNSHPVVQVAAAYHEGATGGASITASTFTFGGTDAIGLTDSDQYQGGAYTATRWLATGAREGLITAGTLGSAQLARAGVYGARYTTVGLNSFDAGRSAYDVAEGVRNGDGLQAGLGALGLAGGARAIGEIADTRRLVGAGDGASGIQAVIRHPFAEGATHITTSSRINRFPGSKTFGGPDGLFVSPSNQIDDLLLRSRTRADIEVGLGLERGALSSGDLIRIDISNPLSRNIRLPDPSTGNIFHRPRTGLTTGNLNEAVITSPLKTDASIRSLILPTGGR